MASKPGLMDGGTGRVNELKLEIDTPEGFSFAATVLSHGWRNLAPFEYDQEAGALSRTERLPAGGLALVRVSAGGGRSGRCHRKGDPQAR